MAFIFNLNVQFYGVFVAGDLHRGASLVVWAIRDGMDAARSITAYLDNRLQVLGAAE